MKCLKKLIYKYRKQLFAITTIFSIVISSIAYVGAWDDPNYYEPTGPRFETPVYLINDYYHDAYSLLFNSHITMIYNSTDSDIFPIITPLNFRQSDTVIKTQLEYDDSVFRTTLDCRMQYVNTIPYSHNAVLFRFPQDYVGVTSRIDIEPFWYIPYNGTVQNGVLWRHIFMIRFASAIAEAHPYIIFNVKGKFSFMGNNEIIEFNVPYGMGMIGNGFNFRYTDILSEVGIQDNRVPMYFHELYIELPNEITDKLLTNSHNWVGIYTPIATVEELAGNELNNFYLYHNTVNTVADFELDLEWIIDGVQGFLNSELFMGITFGGIFMLAITCTLAIFVLKMLNHLK